MPEPTKVYAVANEKNGNWYSHDGRWGDWWRRKLFTEQQAAQATARLYVHARVIAVSRATKKVRRPKASVG